MDGYFSKFMQTVPHQMLLTESVYFEFLFFKYLTSVFL